MFIKEDTKPRKFCDMSPKIRIIIIMWENIFVTVFIE